MTIPFNVLVVSDLGSEAGGTPGPLGPFLPEEGINPVLGQVSPSVQVEVPDWRGEGQKDKKIRAQLGFTDIKSFRPRGVAGQIPELVPLLNLLQGAREVKAGLSPRESLVPLVQEITGREVRPTGKASSAGEGRASVKVSKEDVLSSLFDLVDTGGGRLKGEWPAPPAGKNLWELLDEAGDYLLGDAGASATKWLEMLEAAAQVCLDTVLSAVYADEDFQRLEASWLGLRFLMERTPKATDVRIYCLSAKGEGAMDFLEALSREVWAVDEGHMPSLILWDQYIDSSPPALSLLQRMGDLAEAFMVPVVGGTDLSLFQVRDWDGFMRLPYLPTRLSEPGFGAWQTLVRQDSSRWIALGFNPVLLRPVYDQNYVRDKFPFSQPPWQTLWGTPVWALGALVVRGFAASGWPYLPSGPGGILLEDMPVAQGPHGVMPLKYPVSESRAMELADCGIAALVSPRADDKAWVFSDIVLRGAVSRADRAARAQCALSHQLFLTRFLRLLDAAKKLLPSDMGDQDMAVLLRDTIAAWTGQKGVKVDVQGDARGRLVSIHLESVPHVPAAPGMTLEVRFPG